jgi:hypothetical protein
MPKKLAIVAWESDAGGKLILPPFEQWRIYTRNRSSDLSASSHSLIHFG